MYITSKKYTHEGRIRFGSAIFVDDLQETRIDTLQGEKRDPASLIVLISLIIAKFLSANVIGIFITLPLFGIIYFQARRRYVLNYTTHRVLVQSEYSRPQMVKTLGHLLLINSGLLVIRLLIGQQFNLFQFRIEGMGFLFSLLELYDSRFFLYRNFVQAHFFLLTSFDAVFTISVSFWFYFQFRTSGLSFTEINHNHLTEQLIRLKSEYSLGEILGFIIVFILTQILLFSRFSLVLFVGMLLLFTLLPRKNKVMFSLVGPSNRVLVKNAMIPVTQFANLSRTTATTFGWIPQRDQASRAFPSNIVPEEVSSTFETGLRAYGLQAYRQANVLGVFIATLSNIFVIVALVRFVITSNSNAMTTVIFIGLGLMGVTIIGFVLLGAINRIRARNQRDEKLLIGNGFVARYLHNSLWILKSSSMEGTTVQLGRSHRLLRYDNTRGLIIEWERFTLISIFMAILILIGVWNYLGAINLRAIPLLFPSLIDLGLEFLEQKASAELEFFIIGGFILWIIVVILYPRYYARSRPTLFLDMEYATVEPILLKDFEEHQDASVQFTKSLISATDRTRKMQKHRPGTFIVAIEVKALVEDGQRLRFFAGENKLMRELYLPKSENTVLYRHMICSALKGYPEIDMIVELHGRSGVVLFSTMTSFALVYERQITTDLDLGQFGQLQFTITIKKQKA